MKEVDEQWEHQLRTSLLYENISYEQVYCMCYNEGKQDHVSELNRTVLKLESFPSDNSYSGVLLFDTLGNRESNIMARATTVH